MSEPWVTFTRRTDDPKLAWLERQLDAEGIPHRRNGQSFHAPILEVPEDREEAAWALLPLAVDDMPDDDPMFVGVEQLCDPCERFFATFTCTRDIRECDCPPCQGYCLCVGVDNSV